MKTAVPQTKGKTLENNPVLCPWQGTVLGILSLIRLRNPILSLPV